MTGRVLTALAVVAVAVTACGSGSSRVSAPIEPIATHVLRAPTGAVFEKPVWVAREKRLIFTIIPPGKGTDAAFNHLYSMRLDGSGLARLSLPEQAGCKLTSQSAPVALRDGRIAYLQECWGQEIPHNAKYLRTFDLETGRVGYLRPYSLVVSAGVFAVGPGGAVVINDGRGLSERLLRLTRDRAVPLRLPFLRVGRPSWSPDGRTIALDAVPKSVNARGVARLDLRRNLYLLDDSGRVRRVLLRGLSNAGLAAWSPNGRWLALALEPAHGEAGLYLVNVENGSLRLVQRGDFGSAAWLSERALAASVGVFSDLPGGRGRAGLERIDLPALP